MRILRFNWLIRLYLFMSLVRIASFLIVKTVVSGKNSLIFRFSSDTTSTDHCARTSFWCDSFLTIQFWTKTMKKLVRNHQKIAKKKTIQKIETVRYLELLDHTFSDQNYSKVCKFRTYTTSHSFFDYFSLIFQISIFQWLKCQNLKYELNRSYNGGGVVYCMDEWDASLFHHT